MSGGESEKKYITILVDNQQEAAIQRLYRQNGWDYEASVTGELINNTSFLT